MVRLTDIQRARRHLAAGGIPSPETLATRDGYTFIAVEGEQVEVERYVEHDANMDTWPRLKAGLPWMGRTHALLSTSRVGRAGRHPRFANHIEPQAAFAGTLQGVQRIRSWNPTAKELAVAAAAEELAHLVHEAERDTVASLPRRLVHGGFWHNNVLFRGRAVVLVTDLDFMRERLRIDDLALTLYFANSSIGGERLSDQRLRQLRALIDAYDSGQTQPLSPAERLALPVAMARQPLWDIGGWVVSLPDIERARRVALGRIDDVKWTLHLMRDLERWREAFAG